jgi:hypothetical protein
MNPCNPNPGRFTLPSGSRMPPNSPDGYVKKTEHSTDQPVVPKFLAIDGAETHFITLGRDGYAKGRG